MYSSFKLITFKNFNFNNNNIKIYFSGSRSRWTTCAYVEFSLRSLTFNHFLLCNPMSMHYIMWKCLIMEVYNFTTYSRCYIHGASSMLDCCDAEIFLYWWTIEGWQLLEEHRFHCHEGDGCDMRTFVIDHFLLLKALFGFY